MLVLVGPLHIDQEANRQDVYDQPCPWPNHKPWTLMHAQCPWDDARQETLYGGQAGLCSFQFCFWQSVEQYDTWSKVGMNPQGNKYHSQPLHWRWMNGSESNHWCQWFQKPNNANDASSTWRLHDLMQAVWETFPQGQIDPEAGSGHWQVLHFISET